MSLLVVRRGLAPHGGRGAVTEMGWGFKGFLARSVKGSIQVNLSHSCKVAPRGESIGSVALIPCAEGLLVSHSDRPFTLGQGPQTQIEGVVDRSQAEPLGQNQGQDRTAV
jgi:hypothetical protein